MIALCRPRHLAAGWAKLKKSAAHVSFLWFKICEILRATFCCVNCGHCCRQLFVTSFIFIYLFSTIYPIRTFPFNLYIHRPCRAVFCDAAAGQSVDWWRNTSPPRRSTIWVQVKKTQRFCGKGLDISGVYDGNTPSSQLTSPFSRGKACVNRQSISIATYVSLPKAKGYISIPRWIAIDIESMEDDGKILAPVEFISLAHYF